MDGATAYDWRLDWPEWQAGALAPFAQRCVSRFSACLVECDSGCFSGCAEENSRSDQGHR